MELSARKQSYLGIGANSWQQKSCGIIEWCRRVLGQRRVCVLSRLECCVAVKSPCWHCSKLARLYGPAGSARQSSREDGPRPSCVLSPATSCLPSREKARPTSCSVWVVSVKSGWPVLGCQSLSAWSSPSEARVRPSGAKAAPPTPPTCPVMVKAQVAGHHVPQADDPIGARCRPE
jgi:hypothetical protein